MAGEADYAANVDMFRQFLGLPPTPTALAPDAQEGSTLSDRIRAMMAKLPLPSTLTSGTSPNDPSQVLTPANSTYSPFDLLGPRDLPRRDVPDLTGGPAVAPESSARQMVRDYARTIGAGDPNYNQDLGGTDPFATAQESPSPTMLPPSAPSPYGRLNLPANDAYGGAVAPAPFMPYGSNDPRATGGGGPGPMDRLSALLSGATDALGRGGAALMADRGGGAGPYGSGSVSPVVQALYGSGSGPPAAGDSATALAAASPAAASPGLFSRLSTDLGGLFGRGGGSPAAAAAPQPASMMGAPRGGAIPATGLFDEDGNSLMTPEQINALATLRGASGQGGSRLAGLISAAQGSAGDGSSTGAMGPRSPVPAFNPGGGGAAAAAPPTPVVAPVTAPSTQPPPTPAAGDRGLPTAPIVAPPGDDRGRGRHPIAPPVVPAAGAAPAAPVYVPGANNVATGGVIDPARTKAIADAAAGAKPPLGSRPFVENAPVLAKEGPAAAANAANAPSAAAKPQTTAAEQVLEQGGQIKANPDGVLAGSLPPNVQGALANHGLKLPSNTWDFLIQLGAGMMAHADRPGMIGVGLGLQEAYAGMTAQQKASYDHSVEMMKLNAQISGQRAQLAVTASNHLLAHEDKVALNAQNEQLRVQQLAIQQQLANQGLANQTLQGNIAQQNADTKAQTEKDRAAAVSQQGEAAFNAAYEKQYADVKGRMPTTLGVPDDAATTRTLAAMKYGAYANRPEVIAAGNRIAQITQEAQANAKAYPNTIPQLQARLNAYGVTNVTLSPR